MGKFKIGDRVVGIGVCENLDIDGFPGTVMAIIADSLFDYIVCFDWYDNEMNESNDMCGHKLGWSVSEEHLKPRQLMQNHEIHIVEKDNRVIALYKEGGKVVRISEVERSPFDIYDFTYYAGVAYERLIQKSDAEKEVKEIKKPFKRDAFIPYLEFGDEHYGNIGSPTLIKDAHGTPLFIGDTVNAYFSG